MLTVIIGAAGVGKSTYARRIAGERAVVSAGAWVRQEAAEFGIAQDHESLARYANETLREDPGYCIRYLDSQLQKSGANCVIEGIRNPGDLLWVQRTQGIHRIVDLGGVGQSDWERAGLAAIRGMRAWLEMQEVAWIDQPSTFLAIPLQIAVTVFKRYLMDQGAAGFEAGFLHAIEIYAGCAPTFVFRSVEGGLFHDIPFSATGGAVYGKGGRGPAVFEPIEAQDVVLFRRDKTCVGSGCRAVGIVHWPDDNLLYYLLTSERGQLLLWPPHKILARSEWEDPVGLPPWAKLRSGAELRAMTVLLECAERELEVGADCPAEFLRALAQADCHAGKSNKRAYLRELRERWL